jgi:hypothetical protein
MNNETNTPDLFADAKAFEAHDAAAAARRLEVQNIITGPTPSEPSKEGRQWSKSTKLKAGVAIGAAVLGGGVLVADHALPEHEIASASTSVQQNEGVEVAVDRDLKAIQDQNVNPASISQREDVISQAVDLHAHENGVVDLGEKVTVVAEKSPILGFVTYEAVENEAPKVVPSPKPSIGTAESSDGIQLTLPPAIDGGTIPVPRHTQP